MRTLFRQQRTVSRDLTIVLVLTITVVILVISLSNYFLTINQAEKVLIAQAADTADNLAFVLAVPLWDVDTTAVTYIADTYQQVDDVAGVKVLDEDGQIIYDSEPVDRTGLLVEQRSINFEDRLIGSVEILFSEKAIVD